MNRPAWAQAWLAWLQQQRFPATWLQLSIGHDGAGWWVARAGDQRPARPVSLSELHMLARHAADGTYRSLPTSPDLVGGWIVLGLGDAHIVEAVEQIYPGCLAAWAAERDGTLRVVDWAEVQRRQTGWQGLVKRVEPGDVEAAVQCFCHDGCCLRRVLWRVADESPLGGSEAVPCYEACNLFVGFAKRIASLRRGEPSGGGDDPRWRDWLERTGSIDVAGEVAEEE